MISFVFGSKRELFDMRAGRLRDRVRFERSLKEPDGGGGYEVVWSELVTVWGQFMPERGREKLERGRIENSVSGVLRVRYSSDVSGVTGSDRAVIDGFVYNIQSVTQPDRRGRALEIVVERGVAV